MSTPTTLTSGGLLGHRGHPFRRGPQWLRATSWTLAAHLYLAAWFWAIAVVAVTIALVVVDRVGTVEVSIAQFAAQGATWFPFAIAIILTGSQIGVHVANGMTRRSFLRAALLSVLVSALVYALVMSTLLLVEGAVFDRMGWPHVPDGEDRSAWQDGFGPALLDYGLLFLAGQVSGLLVGITYYRFGGWWGTLLLPLTVAPVLLIQLAGPLVGGSRTVGDIVVPSAVGVAIALALIGLAAYAFARVTRDVPIRPIGS